MLRESLEKTLVKELIVEGVPTQLTALELRDIIGEFGEVIDINLSSSNKTNKLEGSGIVKVKACDADRISSAKILVKGQLLKLQYYNCNSGVHRESIHKRLYFGIENFMQPDLNDSTQVFSSFGDIAKIEILNYSQPGNSSLAYGYLDFGQLDCYRKVCGMKKIKDDQNSGLVYYCFSNKKKLLNAIRSYRFKNNLLGNKSDEKDCLPNSSKISASKEVLESLLSLGDDSHRYSTMPQFISEPSNLTDTNSNLLPNIIHHQGRSTLFNICYFSHRNPSSELRNFKGVKLRTETLIPRGPRPMW